MTHHPLLINAAAMAQAHSRTFDRPSLAQIARVGEGSQVKIALKADGRIIQGERFWVRVMAQNGEIFIGRMQHDLLAASIKQDDLVHFHVENIFEISR